MTSTTQPVEHTFSVNELADDAGVTRRTVHYYISQGLLPASGAEGRASRYGQAHLHRLRLIRQLQREHLPLAEIRQRLEHLSDAQVAELVAPVDPVTRPRGTAFDYIQSVLAGTDRRSTLMAEQVAPAPTSRALVAPPPAAALPPGANRHAVAREAAPAYGSPASAAVPQAESPSPTRSQWERIGLAPDIELHVRRPLSRLQNKAVDRLVGLARQLLEEDPS